MRLPSSLALPCRHLGVLLEAFRTHSTTRLGTNIPLLVAALEARGYRISGTAYQEIEARGILADDTGHFVDAFAVCLVLDPDEHQALRVQLAFDILRPYLGEELACRCLQVSIKDERAAGTE